MVDRDWGGQDRLDHVHAMTEVLPKDERIDVSRAGVMNPVLYRGNGMQHKAMSNVLGQGPCHEAATEQKNGDRKLKG